MIRHKFNAVRTEVNGEKFSSKREARYYQQLLLAQKSGELLFFLRQVPIYFTDGSNVKYICDFVEFWKNGEVIFRDVKGMKTAMYRLKKKVIESQYPIKIEEI